MKKQISISLILICITFISYAQVYKTHKVNLNETIESISKHYLVTPFDLLALNPEAKTNFKPDLVLIIPQTRVLSQPIEKETIELVNYKTHKVRRKETLYSISRKYNITVEDIKNHNKRLYSENLRKGDRINIPRFKTTKTLTILENTLKTYKIKEKEGKWRVAYKYGITVEELETINPGLGETLQLDQEINVPNIANNEEQTLDEKFDYYSVLPKEGFYRLKIKLGLTQEELEQLNPNLRESGLKNGMILKVPLNTLVDEEVDPLELENNNLIERLKNFNTKRIAVLFPFRLHRIDVDSVNEAKKIIKNDSYLSTALDFHSGVLMAIDSLKQHNISTTIDVYDTEARTSTIASIINTNNFKMYDAVIGPFTQQNFDRAARLLKNHNVPIVSPLTIPKNLFSNVFQTIPSNGIMYKAMVNFVKKDTIQKKILIISDWNHKSISNKIKEEFPNAIQIYSKVNSKGKDEYNLFITDLQNRLKDGLNVVFLETKNEGFVSNIASMLSALKNDKKQIVLVTTNKTNAFSGANVSNYNLSNLNFHYPSIRKHLNIKDHKDFIKKYKAMYKTEPNRFAVRGFDLTMDIILRLASKEGTLYNVTYETMPTEYVENKFNYSRQDLGGYINQAVYIIKYLDLERVEAQ